VDTYLITRQAIESQTEENLLLQNKTQEEREKKKAIEAGFVYIYIPSSLPKHIKIKIQQSTLVYRREQ